MAALFENILTASFHGSIVIAAVLVLRLVLRKASRKYICWLWLLAGLRLLMPFEVQSELSLQPVSPVMPMVPPVLVLILWGLVAAGFLVYSLVSFLTLRKKVRFAVKIPGGYETENIETAFILGFIKPKIYIPMGMDATARKHILAHERTHLDKGDHWIKMIGFLALALHWFNPLVWIAYLLLCKDIEMACDERVVQFMELNERKEYSAALLDCSASHMLYMASPVAFGEVSVKSRILSILNYRKPSFWVGLLSITAVGFVTVCLVTSPTQPPQAVEMAVTEPTAAAEEVTPPPAEPVSDWGLSMVAEPLSDTTMTLYTGVDVDGIPWDGTPITKTNGYWLERWTGNTWEKLPELVENPSYAGSYSTEFSKDNVCHYYKTEDLDWRLLYGPLEEGWYRIGILPERQDETRAHYAQFRIWVNSLHGEERLAVERCRAAVQQLLQKNSWSVSLYQTNAQGEELPVRTIYKSNSQGRIDSYIGEYCYNTYYCDLNEPDLTDWAADFELGENRKILFPEGDSSLSGDEIRFVTTWEDPQGIPCREENTYTFGPDGSLVVARRSAFWEDGRESRRAIIVDKAYWGDTTSTVELPQDSFDATADSPWGIFFRVDDDYLAPTGGEVWFGAGEHVGVVPYTTDGAYWLERKAGGKWEKLNAAGTPGWGGETQRLRTQNTVLDVDWSPYYGELEAGLYRMGKHFYNGEESIIQYAEFLIHPQGNIFGEGGEEAIARVNAALERVKNSNYHIVEVRGGGFPEQEEINTVYWKYDGSCVVDFYDYHRGDGYQHSILEDSPEELFYNDWMWVANWNAPNQHVYFAEGASKISQEEITFATAFTGSDSMQSLFCYSVFFDKQDNITRIEYSPSGSLYGEDSRKTIFYFEDTPAEEIAAWVQQIRDQQQ